MRCVHTEEYKGVKIKVYLDPYNYYYKLKFPGEKKYCYTTAEGHDLKSQTIQKAREYIDVICGED